MVDCGCVVDGYFLARNLKTAGTALRFLMIKRIRLRLNKGTGPNCKVGGTSVFKKPGR